MDIVDRIRQLANQKEVSLTKIEKALGFGNGTIGKWIKQSPSCEKIKLVADYLNTSTDYLIYGGSKSVNPLNKDESELLNYYKELDDYEKGRIIGKAEELAEAARRQKALAAKPAKKAAPKAIKPPEPEPSDEPEDETEYVYMPFFDLPVSAGTGVYLDSEDAKKIRVPADDDTRQSDYVLRVVGDSMEPRYYEGDLVLVKQQQYVEEGEVGIFLYNGEGYIKIFGGDRLISLNPKFKDMILNENDQIVCLGRVEGILSIGNKKQ